jgi:pimeloyl-ACP methyl ester carboxylesterase
MVAITTRDGTRIYYKDWGAGPPVVFSQGWPLSADAWDSQMLFLGQHGYSVVAHDMACISEGIRDGFWLQGMRAGIKPVYDCIKQFSETDFTDDLKKIDVPTLVIHGDDDQIVLIDASARATVKLIRRSTLKGYPGAPQGLAETHRDQLNADLLEFCRACGT